MVVPGYTRSSGAYMRYQPSGAELKYFDDTATYLNQGVGLATINDQIVNIAQGTEPFQRIGRSVVIRSIECKINLQAQWAGTPALFLPAAVSYRVDLVLDKQANGAAFGGGDLYEITMAPAAVATNKFLNLYNSDRFVVLKRWEGDMNPPSFPAVTVGVAGNVYVNRDLKLKKNCAVKMEFSGTTGAAAEIRSNSLSLVYSFDCSQAANVSININSQNTRLRFSDM